MTFNIPAALGVGLVTSIIGGLTASKIGPGLSAELRETAAAYADAVQDGDMTRADGLLDGLPQESLFKTWAVRRGDWTEDQYVAARQVNEIALSRADGKGYMPQLVRSPMQMAEDEAVDNYRAKRHDDTLRQLRGG